MCWYENGTRQLEADVHSSTKEDIQKGGSVVRDSDLSLYQVRVFKQSFDGPCQWMQEGHEFGLDVLDVLISIQLLFNIRFLLVIYRTSLDTSSCGNQTLQ